MNYGITWLDLYSAPRMKDNMDYVQRYTSTSKVSGHGSGSYFPPVQLNTSRLKTYGVLTNIKCTIHLLWYCICEH